MPLLSSGSSIKISNTGSIKSFNLLKEILPTGILTPFNPTIFTGSLISGWSSFISCVDILKIKLEGLDLTVNVLKVSVRAFSRIHLGIIDLNGNLGRLYGSMGLAIKEPSFEAKIELSDVDRIIGGDEVLLDIKRRICSLLNISKKHEIEVRSMIPRHVGLGSVTQTSLAIATGLAILHGIEIDVKKVASDLGRGRISGIGTYTFMHGGFILDGGLASDSKIPPMLLRLDFPEEWYIVLAIPHGMKGLSDEEELKAFKSVQAQPNWIPERISRLVLLKLVPAILEKDIYSFGDALTEIQKLVGLTFSNVQGGIYSSKATEDCINIMLSEGGVGAGQSSWGPTAYCFSSSSKLAYRIADAIRLRFDNNCKVIVTSAMNRGAIVKPLN